MIKDSEFLLQKTLEEDSQYVSEHIEILHTSKSAPNFYNGEQALQSSIRLSYIAAIDDYV